MITGFEIYTKELNSKEEVAAKWIYRILKRTTKEPRTNKEIRRILKTKGIEITGPRVRKCINWIRLRGYLPRLIASSKGYKIAQTKEELATYIVSMKERIDPQIAIKNMCESDYRDWE